MNIQRLLYIAQEADKNGDYITADKVDNLLKTAQMPGMPQMNQQMPGMPQMNQQMPQQGGVYNPGMAPNAVYFKGANLKKPQPQMTEEQKAFADLRNLRGQVQQADQVVQKQRMKPKYYPIYQTYQQPVYQGTDTQAQYNFNPNAPKNMNLYGTGYASMAMAPQQPIPQQPQVQQTYQNYYNNAMMQQQPQQNFPQANHSGDFYFKSDNGGPIDQSMNVAFGTQNTFANYKDGNPDMTSSRK